MDPENTNNQEAVNTPQTNTEAPSQTPETAQAPIATPEPAVETPVTAQPIDPTPQMSSAMTGEVTVNDKKPTGAIIGSIAIIVIIILGGLYMWGKQISNQELELTGPTSEEIAAEEDVVLADLSAQGESDDLSDIEADLNDTELSDLDNELDNIDLNF